MFRRFCKRKISDYAGLFSGHFVDAKALYALEFDAVCCISFIGEIDASRAFACINDLFKSELVNVYQHSWFEHNEQEMLFNNTIFLLTNQRMIELGNNWCQVLHAPGQHAWANAFIRQLSQYRIVSNEPVIGFARQKVTRAEDGR